MCETENGFITLRPRRNDRLFTDDISKYIFFSENELISTTTSLKFVHVARINIIAALDQIMAWRINQRTNDR